MLNTLLRHIYTMHGIASVRFTWVPQKEYWIYAIADAIIARRGQGFTSTWTSRPWLVVDDWTATGQELANILLFTTSLMAWLTKEYYSKPFVAKKHSWAGEWTAWKPVSELVPSQHCPPTSSSSSSSSSDGKSVSGTKPVPLRTWLWENRKTKWSYVDSWFLVQIRHVCFMRGSSETPDIPPRPWHMKASKIQKNKLNMYRSHAPYALHSKKKVVPAWCLWFGIRFFTSLGRLPIWQLQLMDVANPVVRSLGLRSLHFHPTSQCAWEATLKVTPFGACSCRAEKGSNSEGYCMQRASTSSLIAASCETASFNPLSFQARKKRLKFALLKCKEHGAQAGPATSILLFIMVNLKI